MSGRIEQSTFNRLNSGLYKAMVFTERHGKRTYQPQERYYYTNLYDPANVAMVKSYLTNYIDSHDSSVELKSITFRMPDSNNLIGLATVAVHVLPGVTTILIGHQCSRSSVAYGCKRDRRCFWLDPIRRTCHDKTVRLGKTPAPNESDAPFSILRLPYTMRAVAGRMS